jgi:hypothetical protein
LAGIGYSRLERGEIAMRARAPALDRRVVSPF